MTKLLEIQKWFGAMISQPLQHDHKLPPKTPFETETKRECEKYITPSPTLHSFQRIQIYHQQYWWRLLKTLQSNFPTVTRLFGYDSFNQRLAIPYLSKNPPSHWSLSRLGDSFAQWLHQTYNEKDRYLVLTSAEIDWATQEAFSIGSLPTVDFAKLSTKQTLSKTLILQPHIHLFELRGDLFSFREEFLKQEVDYFNTHPFPQIRYGTFYFAVYRSPKNHVSWKEISAAEFQMLSLFKKGNTIEKACQTVEQDETLFEEASTQLPFWFKQWTVLQWFGQS